MTSLFRCCTGGGKHHKRPKAGSQPASTTLSKEPNGQHNLAHQSISEDDVERPRPPSTRRALPIPPLADGSAAPRVPDISKRPGLRASLNLTDNGPSTPGVPYFDGFNPDDYDSPVERGPDGCRVTGPGKTQATTFSRSSAGSVGGVTTSTTVNTSYDEQSLDHLVAHLLGELPLASPTSSQADPGQAVANGARPGLPLCRSMTPNSELECGVYDVPKLISASDDEVFQVEVQSDVLSTGLCDKHDENDNVASALTDGSDSGVMDADGDYDVPRSQDGDMQQMGTATLGTSTGSAVVNAVNDSESAVPKVVVSPASSATGELHSGSLSDDQQTDHVYSLPHNYNIMSLEPYTERSFIVTQPSTDSVEHAVQGVVMVKGATCGVQPCDSSAGQNAPTSSSPMGSDDYEGQKTPDSKTPDSLSLKSPRDSCEMAHLLFEQFKGLRLEVLTSVSQLLNCIGGTWKHGRNSQMKLAPIKLQCMALSTSLNKFENFMQMLILKSAESNRTQLYDGMNEQVQVLQKIQNGLDRCANNLDTDEPGSSTPEVTLGTIIHLTKEIPVLIRTFVPLIELMAHYETKSANVTSQHADGVTVTEPVTNLTAIVKECSDQLETQHTQNTDFHQQHRIETVKEVMSDSSVDDRVTVETSAGVIKSSNELEHNPSKSYQHENSDILKEANGHAGHDGGSVLQPNNNDEIKGAPGQIRPRIAGSMMPPPTPPPKQRSSSYRTVLGLDESLALAQKMEHVKIPDGTQKSNAEGSLDEHHQNHQETGNHISCQHVNSQETARSNPIQSLGEDTTLQECINLDDIASPTAQHLTSVSLMSDGSEAVSSQGTPNYYEPVVMRRSLASTQSQCATANSDMEEFRISQSELVTPDIRASGISQTMVDQLEELQREANTQHVRIHTEDETDYDNFDIAERASFMHQSQLCEADQRLLMFYCDQMTGNWNVLDNAASAFFHCMERRQPPKVFVMHSRFVILAGHKMAYIGDILAKNVVDDSARDWIVAHSNRLCNCLKLAVRTTKEAALGYPALPAQQMMVDSIKEVTDWAIELKEVVDRLTYLGRPDHILA